MKIDGRAIASEILGKLKSQVEELEQKEIIPTLAIILIGDDESSKSYVKQKQLKADEVGIKIKLFHFESTSQDALLELIEKLNNDPKIHGIIVQRPLPEDFDRNKIANAVNPSKDVDGFNPNSPYDAPVAQAVFEILKNIGFTNLKNKQITVIGKGETAGGPIIKMLSKLKTPPIVIDRQTKDPKDLIESADIVICAVGKENTVKPEFLNSNQTLIGVGLSSRDGKLKGDYDESKIENRVKYFTPTPGGVGPVNVACLMQNLVKAAEISVRHTL